MPANRESRYRPDIDGLRAVAILLVVVFHAFPTVLPGGFIGVDVFFVISGFLISRLILEETQAGTFSLLRFYGRRCRRIAPALILVLTGTLVSGYFLLPGFDFFRIGAQMVAAASFTSNLLITRQEGYFDTASDLKPFLHLWSLAVEEQFYLIWPVVLSMAVGRMNATMLAVALGLLSFGLNLAGVRYLSPDAFYLLPTRFWELLVGAVLASSSTRRDFWRPAILRSASFANLIALVSVGSVIAAAATLGESSPFQGWWALCPTLATAALIAVGDRSWLNRTILSSRPFVVLGLISYPLYLWHWPLLSFARILSNGAPTDAAVLGIVGLSVVLAVFTWACVELPIRPLLNQPRTAIAGALGSLAVLALVGILIDQEVIVSVDGRQNPVARDLRGYTVVDLGPTRFGRCYLDSTMRFRAFEAVCTQGGDPPSEKHLLLLGDSHAAHLYPGMVDHFAGSSTHVWQMNVASCPPFLRPTPNVSPTCRTADALIFAEVARLKPDLILLFAEWSAYDQQEGFPQRFRETIEAVRRLQSVQLMVIGPAPQWTGSLPVILERDFLRAGHPLPSRMAGWQDPRSAESDAKLRELARQSRVPFVSLRDGLCGVDGCLAMVGANVNEDVIMHDYAHFTRSGGKWVMDHILGHAIDGLIRTQTP